MSAPLETSDATFNADLPEQGITVIDFWASWCGPCRAFAPVFAESAARNHDVKHLKVDVDANPNLARIFKVQSIPTTLLMRDRYVVGVVAGAMSSARLDDAISQVRQLEDGSDGAHREHPANDVSELVDAGAVVVDVREPDEFARGSIPGASNIPLSRLPESLSELPKSAVIALVCRSGARSLQAQRTLVAAGFDAVNLAGGMAAWRGPTV